MDRTRKRKVFKLETEMKNHVLEASRSANEDGKMDLSKLCKDLSIEVFNFDFSNKHVSGALIRDKDDGKWRIFVSSNDSPRRKRFTVAHEIGHYLSYINGGKSKAYIDGNGGSVQDYSIMLRADDNVQDQDNEAELEANEIAAELLMPENAVKDFYSQGKTIEEMADSFIVSESAMTIRILNLGYRMMEEPTETEEIEGIPA